MHDDSPSSSVDLSTTFEFLMLTSVDLSLFGSALKGPKTSLRT